MFEIETNLFILFKNLCKLTLCLFVLAGCETNSTIESLKNLTGKTPVNDGTVNVPETVKDCISSGYNKDICLLKAGRFFYTQENGGRTPDISSDYNIANGKYEGGKMATTIPPGYYNGTAKITFLSKDSGGNELLIADNIRDSVTILGVTGTAPNPNQLPPACNILSLPVTASVASPCLLSKDLNIYTAAYGGRSAVCDTADTSVSKNNCWINDTKKYYLTSTLETPVSQCSIPGSGDPLVSQACWIDAALFPYSAKYGGRGTLCATTEDLNSTPCWADQISTEIKGYVTSSTFNNWCLWDQKTTKDCRIRVAVPADSGTPNPVIKSAGYVYKDEFGGRNKPCINDEAGFCWTAVSKDTLEPNLVPDVIQAGKSIFGVQGKFRGEGSWKSGAHRDSYAYPIALSDEAFVFGGSGNQETGLPDGYREVAMAKKDSDATFDSFYVGVDRTGWGSQQCGTGAVTDILPNGFQTWTLRARMSHCAGIFQVNAIWNGQMQGNAGQAKWKLVVRKFASSKLYEVWLDDNTGMLWSTLVSNSIDWCKATGNNEGDIAVSGSCKNLQGSGDPVSACFEGSGFTQTNDSLDMNGKGGLNKTSSDLQVVWRIPTIFDYEVAEYNGIRFVMPDMGKALPTSSQQFEWMGTINSADSSKAWVFSSKLGKHAFLGRNLTAGVRCIGRADTLN